MTNDENFFQAAFLKDINRSCNSAIGTVDFSDQVNSPNHYKSGGIETIDYIEAKLSKSEFEGYLKGNILKYISRASLKGSEIEDYKKAEWYLKKMIENQNLGGCNV